MSTSLFSPLLPLYGLSVTLEFTEPAEFTFFHQMTVDAFCRSMLGSPEKYKQNLTSEAPESGRLHYTLGDYYRFSLLSFGGHKNHFQPFISRLLALPDSAPVKDKASPLRNNIKLHQLTDLVDSKPLVNAQGLDPFTAKHLIDMAHAWQPSDTQYPRQIQLQWLSPVRLMRNSDERKQHKLTGEARFCRDKSHITPALLVQRIIESLITLMSELGHTPNSVIEPQLYQGLALTLSKADLFWVDTPYYSKDQADNTNGGMIGQLTLTQTAPIPYGIWQGLILGQFIGVGQRRTSGMGKYQLLLSNEQPKYNQPFPLRSRRAQTLLSLALDAKQLNQAIALAEQKETLSQKQQAQINTAVGQLNKANYQPPPLFGQLIPKKDGSDRTLAVAPLFDRVLQKSVSLTLSPSIDAIFYHRSFAYRKGHSRQQARFDIQQAWREGYRWVYESDVEDFFDAIDRRQLLNRLTALFGQDPIFDAINAWLSCDVVFNGQRIERPTGIPQGSPLSPLLANFILDDFDNDLETHGFRLVRFADDFIILCKSKMEAELAAEVVKNSLAELGLSINQEKSHIVSLEQGFKFLGYLFQNEWAVDIGGKTNDGTLTFSKDDIPEHLPPWLANLGERQAIDLESRLNESLGKVGQIDDAGVFLTIAGESSVLSTDNGQLVVKRDEMVTHSLPLAHLQGVLVFGNHHLTTPLIKAALKAQIPIHIANRMGDYEGAIWKRQPIDNSYKHWFLQLQHFDNTHNALSLAKSSVHSRLHNMQRMLQRHHKNLEVLASLKKIDQLKHKIEACSRIESLLGIEGSATKAHFNAMAQLLPDWCEFKGRNRRPPKDPFNVLLSFGYTWLYAHADAILISLGFLTWKGYYHQTSSGHAALASDVIESYRHIIERAAITAVNTKQIQLEDFRIEDEKLRLSSEARRKYITQLEKRFLKITNAQTLWQALHQQGKSLLANINHYKPYCPYLEP